MKNSFPVKLTNLRRAAAFVASFALVFALLSGLSLPVPLAPSVEAGNTYFNLSGGGNLSLNLTPSSVDVISSNDDWTLVPSIEGYFGRNLVNTFGVDPQIVLTSEYAALPSAGNTHIQANKGNPNAVNNGGLAEFDSGPFLAFGFQGNVQSTPYLVFYLNTTGRSGIRMRYDVIDIDAGSNDSVSQIALQYRVGSTGNFTNIPAGFVADATDGGVAGRVTSKLVTLPTACDNKPQIQVRLITTNAAAADGTSTPDEWIGVNNIIVTGQAPTAATVNVGGQVISPFGRPLMNAAVNLFDSYGNVRTARTNPFGYYTFEDVEVGQTCILEIRSKRYSFTDATRALFVTENMDAVNFYADPFGTERPKTDESTPTKSETFPGTGAAPSGKF
jgi:hypothetical protein